MRPKVLRRFASRLRLEASGHESFRARQLPMMFAEGHAVGLHSSTRAYVLLSPEELADRLTAEAARIEILGGTPPCRAFRPHAGWRGGRMYDGLEKIDDTLVGWGWMLWDWNWFRARTADSTLARLAARVSPGDIMVMHDGDESAPLKDQRQTVEATAGLVPELRARGFAFGTVCQNGAGMVSSFIFGHSNRAPA